MNINTTDEILGNNAILELPDKLSSKEIINYKKIKRLMDVVLSSIGLIVLLPVFLIISIAIKLDSKGPVFFAHKRIGKNGKIIKLYT